MSLEKVSIHIPAFNSERTIDLCIQAILNQSIAFDEIIIINDNSKDKTSDIIKKYPNIILINNNKNMGLSYNRNKAISISKNNIIASVDSDVILDKFWLESLIGHLNKENILMCGGNMKEKLITNKYNLWRAKYYSQNWGDKDILNPPFLFGCNTLQKKKIWEEIGGYDCKYKTNGEDIDYSNKVRSLKKGDLFYSSKAMCYHLQDDNLVSLSNRVWRYHGYGYKLQDPSLLRLIKLTLKQFKFMFKRIFQNILPFNFHNILISFRIFLKFLVLEYNFFNKKK